MVVGGKELGPVEPEGKPRRVCVVTSVIGRRGEDDAAMPELARLFAGDGDDVTLVWVPGPDAPSSEVVATHRGELEAASIRLQVLDRSDQLLPWLATPESRSAALLHYLERSGHDLVYAPLEGGLPYFTLLAAETAAFAAPPIVAVAHAPSEWADEADKAFMDSTEAIAVAHMEKYCAEMADSTVCASAALRKWMLSRGWKVRKATVAPLLRDPARRGRRTHADCQEKRERTRRPRRVAGSRWPDAALRCAGHPRADRARRPYGHRVRPVRKDHGRA
ncbi:MAG: glycosyltransferase family 4 protein [Mesorhizobium sp.]|nr:MAG: glycosyltransferase family 4 protein [Mesorhizobium sp.]